MKNAGKIFEEDFKKSVPSYCYLYRLKDSAQAFGKNTNLRFSSKNPCDFFLFDTKDRVFYGFELKSTKEKSISFEYIDKPNESTRMVHKHQILGLLDLAQYDNICAGFMCNFRADDSQKLYYIDINKFMKLYNGIEKCSFNQNDLLMYGAIEIDGTKKRSHYLWDIGKVFKYERGNRL